MTLGRAITTLARTWRTALAPGLLALLVACAAPTLPRPSAPPPEPPIAVRCDDALGSVGDAAPDLPEPGAVVRCSREAHLDADALRRTLGQADLVGLEPVAGAHVLRVAYATTRADGSRALATARAWIPDRAIVDALAIVAHPTVGLADACAPSRQAIAGDALVAPWPARGWPTIAPDYAGLGTPGVQGYGDGDDTARSVLDAVRALRAILGEGTPEPYVVVGHSQGGGAALSAQAIVARYGPPGLALAIALSPGWPVRASLATLRDPARRTRGGEELSAVVGAMALYAWSARELGDGAASFPADRREALSRALERECIGSLVTTIPHAAPTLGALIDPALREGLVACEDGVAGCEGIAARLHAWARANVLSPDPTGAAIAIVEGEDDRLITPARARCVVDHVRASGMAPHVCVVPRADHVTIVPRAMPHALALAEAALAGTAAPACPGSDALPACSLP